MFHAHGYLGGRGNVALGVKADLQDAAVVRSLVFAGPALVVHDPQAAVGAKLQAHGAGYAGFRVRLHVEPLADLAVGGNAGDAAGQAQVAEVGDSQDQVAVLVDSHAVGGGDPVGQYHIELRYLQLFRNLGIRLRCHRRYHQTGRHDQPECEGKDAL